MPPSPSGRQAAMHVNLGCGHITYPNEPHWSHHLLPADLLRAGEWHNVDRNAGAGVDETVDLFTYPWPWADNTFDGALASHLVEHIPHAPHIVGDSDRAAYLAGLQDGWFAFFAELWRVLKPGSVAHILVPHGQSDGAKADPTHTRYVMPQTFGYFLEGQNGKQFSYATGSVWRLGAGGITYRITEMFQHLIGDQEALQMAIMTRLNVVYEFYAPLEVVKDADSH